MKITADIFDIVFLVFLLGLMLPVLFSSIGPLTDMQNWGFSEPLDDKTMQAAQGDVLPVGNRAYDDSMTAAEIILLTRFFPYFYFRKATKRQSGQYRAKAADRRFKSNGT